MTTGYTFGRDYPDNPMDYRGPTEFRYRIESDNLPEIGDRFAASRLFTDTFFETEREGRATAQLMANEMGLPVEVEVWTVDGWGEPYEIYNTLEVKPDGKSAK